MGKKSGPRKAHQFGGIWTEQKLAALKKYLVAYQTIFKQNLAAQHYRTIYVDAFAGTGARLITSSPQLLELREDEVAYKNGSVRVALELPRTFDRYVFIERKRIFVTELGRMIAADFAQLMDHCEIHRAEANSFLTSWCALQDWRATRAVVFLDPYGMTVEWRTIKALARTKGVDLWILLPVGVGINRVLVRGGLPTPVWGKRLTRLFGTADWAQTFYEPVGQHDMFTGDAAQVEKVADFNAISAFFIKRLQTLFPYVADKPRHLMNSKKNPLFALHFASHNKTGLKIANHILTH
jgi:three-Cys-motif partner protein